MVGQSAGPFACAREFPYRLPGAYRSLFADKNPETKTRAKYLFLCGEPAGTRTQDHLIKSFLVTPFSIAESTMAVANFDPNVGQKWSQTRGFGNQFTTRSRQRRAHSYGSHPAGFELLHRIDCKVVSLDLLGVVAHHGGRHADDRPDFILRAADLKQHDDRVLAEPVEYDAVLA